jgi:hypothetical protein
MSKKYKGKTCVYCGVPGSSEIPEHVLARAFVLERHRRGLPIVPACRACNNAKSKLETSLTTFLPFGARHVDALENLRTMVPGRLRANSDARTRLKRGLDSPRWVPSPSGIYQRTSIVPVDTEQLEAWVRSLTIGLIWHHWKVIAAGAAEVTPMLLTQEGERYLAPMFHMKAAHRVHVTSIGGDALIYEGIMDASNPLGSLWRFAIYGGIQLGGDDPRVRASTYYVTVIPHARSAAA